MDLHLPDGQYLIAVEVKEGRVVNVRTKPEAGHLLDRLIVLLALSLNRLIALCFTSSFFLEDYEIVNKDGSKGDAESLYQELLVAPSARKPYQLRNKYYPGIYLLRSDSKPGWVKIGKTKHPGTRAGQLQGQIIHYIPCLTADPEEYEAVLRNCFVLLGRERQGEWFRLTDVDVQYVESLKTWGHIKRNLRGFMKPRLYRENPQHWHSLYEIPQELINQ